MVKNKQTVLDSFIHAPIGTIGVIAFSIGFLGSVYIFDLFGYYCYWIGTVMMAIGILKQLFLRCSNKKCKECYG